MDNTTITIIVPVYKAQSTLKRCVDSILAQSYSNWELILVDDGSPDDSGKICDCYAASDSRIRSLHVPNGGAGNARNHGLDHCKTKWVTFVDSDDSLEPGYLANFHLNLNKDEEGAIIMQGYRRVDSSKIPLSETVSLKSAEYVGESVINDAFGSDHIFEYGQVVGKAYIRDFINMHKIRFTTNFHISEDHLFYLTYLLYVNKIITYQGALYNYIWENNNISLSQAQHPYQELYIRYLSLLKVCDDLCSRHPAITSAVLAKIRYFSITASISMILRATYCTPVEKSNRMDMLQKILEDKNLLLRDFRPHSIKGRLLRACLLYTPAAITDALLRFCFRK